MKRNAAHFLIRKLNKLISIPLETEPSEVQKSLSLQIPPLGHSAKTLCAEFLDYIDLSFPVKSFRGRSRYQVGFLQICKNQEHRNFHCRLDAAMA